MAIDSELIRALHVETERHSDLRPEHESHTIFQTSTFDAMLDGAYDGDVTVEELREHGDFGVGTFEGCDGEMIVIDGTVYRADPDGNTAPADGAVDCPFAVVMYFDADRTIAVEAPASHEQMLAQLDREIDDSSGCYALRIEGRFDSIRARSVRKQNKPYPPMTEVAATQNVFMLGPIEGTMVGYRFPAAADGLNVAGYHLHFISSDRKRGGHVFDCKVAEAHAAIDHSSALHLELPAGVDLSRGPDGGSAGTVQQIENG